MVTKKDVVLEHLAVENDHDMEAMLATLHGDDPVRDEVATKSYRGRDDVAGRYASLWESFPDFNVFPRRLVEEGDSVIMLADYSGTHKGVYRGHQPTGKRFNVRIVNIIDFVDDKISRETIFMDLATQLRQLGLPLEEARPEPAAAE